MIRHVFRAKPPEIVVPGVSSLFTVVLPGLIAVVVISV